MMTNTQGSGLSAEARALAALRDGTGSAPSSLDTPETMVGALDAYQKLHGIGSTLELASDLLFHEFSVLAWPPAVGAALARWATPQPNLSALLIHAMASYLALYYPELEPKLAEVQEQLAAQRADRAQQRLAAALDALVT